MTFRPLRHKYQAVRAELDGFKFDSKAEAKHYLKLKAQQAAGEIVGFLRQVPFHIPGGVRYVVDFLVFGIDGTVRFVDVKGMETESFRAKRRIVETLYPWIGQVELVGVRQKKEKTHD